MKWWKEWFKSVNLSILSSSSSSSLPSSSPRPTQVPSTLHCPFTMHQSTTHTLPFTMCQSFTKLSHQSPSPIQNTNSTMEWKTSTPETWSHSTNIAMVMSSRDHTHSSKLTDQSEPLTTLPMIIMVSTLSFTRHQPFIQHQLSTRSSLQSSTMRQHTIPTLITITKWWYHTLRPTSALFLYCEERRRKKMKKKSAIVRPPHTKPRHTMISIKIIVTLGL